MLSNEPQIRNYEQPDYPCGTSRFLVLCSINQIFCKPGLYFGNATLGQRMVLCPFLRSAHSN